ncbi:MAG: MFS transporter [Chthoniobacter sp.]|nr:MFS transporter [Chthoniobacter sp.]
MAQPAPRGFGRTFWMLTLSNGFFFAGFHGLLPTVPLLAVALGGSKTEVGLVAGIFVLSAVLVRLFADQLLRRLGARNCLIAGILIAGGSVLLYLPAPTVGALLAVRILNGAGFGIGTTFYISAVMEFIPAKRRGEGLGYFGLATTLAMASAPATALWVAARWGFPPMFLLAAGAEVVALVTLLFCRLPPRPVRAPLKASASVRAPAATARALAARLVEPGTRRAALMIVLFGTAYGGVLNFVAVYAREIGLDLAGLFFVVATTCIFLARLATRKVYDRFGVAWAVVPGGIVLAAGLVLLANSTGATGFLGAAVLYGWGVGMLFPALQTETMVAVAPVRRAAASATFSSALDLGLGGGSVLLGMLAEGWGLSSAYLAASAALLVMLGVLALVPRPVPPAAESPEKPADAFTEAMLHDQS